MNVSEGVHILDERVVLKRDEKDPQISHIKKVTYIAGTHLEIPGARTHQGWTGEETIVEEEYPLVDGVKERKDGLLWRCPWHDPKIPLPEGFRGFTGGACDEIK